MTTNSERLDSNQNQSKSLADEVAMLDFHLDKTYAALFETGKEIRSGYLFTLLFLGVTAVLVFGEDDDAKVTIPLLGIQLVKLYAAEVTLVLTCASLYSTISSMGNENLLYIKIKDLLTRRFGQEGYHWHLVYPSIISFSEVIHAFSRIGILANVGIYLAITGTLILVVILAVTIGVASSWAIHAIISLIISGTIILLTIINFIASPKAAHDREDVLRRIEGKGAARA